MNQGSTIFSQSMGFLPKHKFRQCVSRYKGAVKMHPLLDLRGNIPSFVDITDGKVHDVNILDALILEPGAISIMDKAYLDFERLYSLHQNAAFFVTRAKTIARLKRLYSSPVDKSTGLRCDQIVALTGFYTKKAYPDRWSPQLDFRRSVQHSNRSLRPLDTVRNQLVGQHHRKKHHLLFRINAQVGRAFVQLL
jgi:hypothetical protein